MSLFIIYLDYFFAVSPAPYLFFPSAASFAQPLLPHSPPRLLPSAHANDLHDHPSSSTTSILRQSRNTPLAHCRRTSRSACAPAAKPRLPERDHTTRRGCNLQPQRPCFRLNIRRRLEEQEELNTLKPTSHQPVSAAHALRSHGGPFRISFERSVAFVKSYDNAIQHV